LSMAEQLDAELSDPAQSMGQEPLDVIAALVDHSLLIAIDTPLDDPRWTMLQTIREFGLDQLATLGEEQAVRKAHAKLIAIMATQAEIGIYGKDQPAWLKLLSAEDANIRAALAWSFEHGERELALLIAGSLWRFWSLRHVGKEGREWLARAIDAPGDASPHALALAYRGAGCLAEDIGDYATAELRHGQALALWEELRDDTRRARTIDDLGNTAHDQGDFERAIALHNLAYEVGEACGNRRVMASAMSNLGAVAYLQGNISLARERWQAVLDGTTIDDPVSRAMVMNNLAVACMHEGDLERAATILEQTLSIHNELGTLSTRADVFTNLSDVATRQGNHDKARAYFAQAIELYLMAEDPKGLHNSYFSLGTEEASQGNAQASLAAFRESLHYADRANNRIGIADTIDQIALHAVSTELAEEAAKLTGAARAIRERLGSTGMPNHHLVVAELEAALRRSLGENRYARAVDEGAEISQRQSTARALDLADRLAEVALPSKAKVATPSASLAAPANPFKLTKREIEVLRLLSQGHTDREIAAELWISPRTAGSHVTNIFAKLDVDSRAAAVAVAFRNNLI
jgi:DNA-binding CsgD family transcriptional regulator/tetratricopeptide (TPR) repeat protein